LIAVPTRWDQAPVEGSKLIPVEVDWGTMGGASNCVSFNLQNNATLNFSQIVALSIDNSACGSDIEFVFPDTTETLSIPSYSPKTILPVFTNQTQFWLSCPSAQSEDITRFSILNSMPPPIAVPTTQEQNIASVQSIAGDAVAATPIISASVSGTLENVFLNWYGSGVSASNANWQLIDGSNNVLGSGVQQTISGAKTVNTALILSDVRIRFQNGVSLKVTLAAAAGSLFSANLYYRTP
jgi:hypothetical protein